MQTGILAKQNYPSCCALYFVRLSFTSFIKVPYCQSLFVIIADEPCNYQ